MEKINSIHFNDVLCYSEKTFDIIHELQAYIMSRCYSAVMLFDGLNIEPKTDIENDIYTWKIQINETLQIKVLMKTTDKNSYLSVDVEWEVWSIPTENKSQMYYLYQFIKKECETLDIFFIVRK